MTGPISRRQFVVAATVFSGVTLSATAFRSRVARAQAVGGPDATLVRVARLLAPHDEISDRHYAEVLDTAVNVFGGNLRASLADTETALDAAAGGDFLAADADIQLAAISSIENAAHFQDTVYAVKLFLYGHPAAWRIMGYEGPSWQFGGYAGRGAGDIDWLPGED